MTRFEIHVTDMSKAMTFYSQLFGWTFHPMAGAEAVEYHRITGAAIDGGMMRRMAGSAGVGAPVRGAMLTFPVADVDVAYAWALANGGAEALPPTDYPGMARIAYCEDGQGNIVGLSGPSQKGG
ncbi:VOC family protein [Puniceibacterium sp. IMCC21224]|uniref:VOC family protein n=1 Tax=Puniceibacterium sp. IMCC21224 TaxID=1618204 RepID=UPI0018CE4A4E|nr:VOC family protein [Puniceibacterium sp. IMCC21224]